MNLEKAVPRVLKKHPDIIDVQLTGSRQKGVATWWSDWDFLVKTTDFKAVSLALPGLINELAPLSFLWDPLANHQIFMFMLKGPVKVDIIFDIPHRPQPSVPADRENLIKINNHFWDWIFWLAVKDTSGRWDARQLQFELEKMGRFLFIPLGYSRRVSSVIEAVKRFLDVFETRRKELKVEINRALKLEVIKGLKGMGYSL